MKPITINQPKDLEELEQITKHILKKDPLNEKRGIGLIRLLIQVFWLYQKRLIEKGESKE